MKKILLLTAVLGVLLALGVYGIFEDKERFESEKIRETETQARTQEAAKAGQELAASFSKLFDPSEDERALLNAGPAVNALGTINGIFTNPQGVSGYFHNYDQPFNFIWTGQTETMKAFDGRTYKLMSGQGNMVLKYMDDERLLQRYEGESRQGLLDGFGEQWSRNNEGKDAAGHHYFSYKGEFRHDLMEGSGAVSDYDFFALGVPPLRYEGEVSANFFHGYGRAIDLATGQMIRKGLWLGGDLFEGTKEEWKRADAEYKKSQLAAKYRDVLMSDNVPILGTVDSGSGVLVIIPPLHAEDVKAVDQRGHRYSFVKLSAYENKELSATPSGSREKRPRADYPLILDLSYKNEGQPHFIRITVLEPVLLVFDEKLAALPLSEASLFTDQGSPGGGVKKGY